MRSSAQFQWLPAFLRRLHLGQSLASVQVNVLSNTSQGQGDRARGDDAPCTGVQVQVVHLLSWTLHGRKRQSHRPYCIHSGLLYSSVTFPLENLHVECVTVMIQLDKSFSDHTLTGYKSQAALDGTFVTRIMML